MPPTTAPACRPPMRPPARRFGLKNTLFRLCNAKVTIVETNETPKRGSGKSGAAKYGAWGGWGGGRRSAAHALVRARATPPCAHHLCTRAAALRAACSAPCRVCAQHFTRAARAACAADHRERAAAASSPPAGAGLLLSLSTHPHLFPPLPLVPPPGVCKTYIYYKFANTALLTAFQLCQSKQALYVNNVVSGAAARPPPPPRPPLPGVRSQRCRRRCRPASLPPGLPPLAGRNARPGKFLAGGWVHGSSPPLPHQLQVNKNYKQILKAPPKYSRC